MALILQIETSTISCSVALSENGQTLSFKEAAERNIHASSITLFIEDVMKVADKKLTDLDAVAVSMGPGSYTGLRIGVSTAKGLCYGLSIPLIAIDTLKAMAASIKINLGSGEHLYCPMIDARRMEVYSAIYNAELVPISPIAANVIEETSFSSILEKHKVVFFGDGAEKCIASLGNHPNAIFITDFTNSAVDHNAQAYDKYNTQLFEDLAYFEPYYLKDFVATTPKAV
ncbi:tRNA (adenosine(37)-N6)-threonylcarbamoyltransferase complex dimerization subunit type 1 TsaB [Arcticibacter eurypsychrophilus]|uniref:tRNA (adenosine(37)-N6)-threonylcarbamoyltransferase complex dimerization subunit type 1 TsaB n=1 Tax=Arcticibacter eurypsychrophilus TaxID=1434752 RepID=UPI00084D9E99|nr:tRNA (adenosine(37)-N6)-threonylcarbamoyltransferase complex dimerization subunit type 1 TsaB [Arcticibacter eurypsychrophilus]